MHRQLRISNMAWGVLLGNALDNAIEACAQAEPGSAHLRVAVHDLGGSLHILITNTAPHQPRALADGSLRTTKADSRLHGLGMHQIQSVVKKYDGVMDTTWNDGQFTLSVLLMNV